jgi:hypothetical protein
MTKTKLDAADVFFDDVQKMIKEVYDLLDPIDDAKMALLECTGFDTVECATVQHAAVGIILAFCASLNGLDVMSMVKISMKDPFIEIDGSKAEGVVKEGIEQLKKYVTALCSCKEKIEAFVEKAKAFGEKAAEVPAKAKDEVAKNEKKLGMMDKMKAMKNCTTNCRQVTKVPALVMELKDTVMGAIEEIMCAAKELEAKKDKMIDCGAKCLKESKKTPKECYLLCGDPIKCEAADKKKHMALMKKRAAIKKMKAKTNPGAAKAKATKAK